MPTKETAARPGIAEHKAATEKLAALNAEVARISDLIPQEAVVGNDVSALQARRVALRSEIETTEEAITALRPHAAVEEQAIMRRHLTACQQVRQENSQRAREAQAHYDDLSRQLDETAKQVDHWRFRAVDGVFTAVQHLERHIAEHGDLSGA
jgi:hypothetical protein